MITEKSYVKLLQSTSTEINRVRLVELCILLDSPIFSVQSYPCTDRLYPALNAHDQQNHGHSPQLNSYWKDISKPNLQVVAHISECISTSPHLYKRSLPCTYKTHTLAIRNLPYNFPCHVCFLYVQMGSSQWGNHSFILVIACHLQGQVYHCTEN